MSFELFERFQYKIKTPAEVVGILGVAPRSEKVIMCHGVFDVVHPGHIRHMLFAKSKAPILIASLTADKHINKGQYRPHIPQELRAINLAALEFVDYVVIDTNDTPIENLAIIKPDYYAKGFEYNPDKTLNQKTTQEIELLNSYGGEIIFTPGDFVLSSSRFITESLPNIKIEKLMLLMRHARISFDDIINAMQSFSNKTVHVVGDTIIDSYTNCSMIGGQTKTPTISVQFESKTDLLGGAGIVAAHLKAAGANVKLTTLLGNDELGVLAQKEFSRLGIVTSLIIDSNRPTVNKNAFVVDNYRLLKVDTIDNRTISDEQLNEIIVSIQSTNADAVVCSDFRHGIFNKRTIERLVQSISPKTYKVADSQVASRWGNILEFKSFDLITPNEREARFSLGDQDSGVRSIAANLYQESKCAVLILKLSNRGIITHTNPDANGLDSYFVMDSFVDNLVDPVGAGDALLAYSTLGMLATQNPVISSILGNLAAACECEYNGNLPVTPEAIKKKIAQIMKSVSG